MALIKHIPPSQGPPNWLIFHPQIFGASPLHFQLTLHYPWTPSGSNGEEDVKAGLIPTFLCATLGTTTTGAVDPIKALWQVTRDFKVWLHIGALCRQCLYMSPTLGTI